MTTPIIAGKQPIAVNLEKGKEYYFCTCGQSTNQPFCDGSHQGTSFAPKSFIAQENGESYLCVCKHTNNAPFCDGFHTKL